MTAYRRDRTPGATWFFTLTLADRRSRLLVERIAHLRAAFRYTMQRHPWRIDAIVILPDHLHALCTLPEGDNDYAVRWRLIKTHFSRSLPGGEALSGSRARKGERGIWQRRYWEHRVRDAVDLSRHIDYIHFNPCKHGQVARVIDWPWSSFHRYVRAGVLPVDWAGGDGELLQGGETPSCE
ncbi:REP-associated tyrosine transposase [Pseudomonas panipatensis]|uniref:Putative transposase n=1 Tax=Pseudomonas panipatensis TaxID=428992 RepID=A0A1G8N3T8_9PSED|nr:transposase [Pseudomonas panipatensis]SDI74240.1 putative transposase [Pseudomonas panipatensis]SMP79732.1 putative transposase [Pseudomonas panipatensis]